MTRAKPRWYDLHLTARIALLDAADRRGWDYPTVERYLAGLPRSDGHEPGKGGLQAPPVRPVRVLDPSQDTPEREPDSEPDTAEREPDSEPDTAEHNVRGTNRTPNRTRTGHDREGAGQQASPTGPHALSVPVAPLQTACSRSTAVYHAPNPLPRARNAPSPSTLRGPVIAVFAT